jgi:hypothetical protein
MVSCRFSDLNMDWLSGYRISACFDPIHGFGGLFFVYVVERAKQ